MKQALKFLVSVALVVFAVSLLDFHSMLRTLKEGSLASFVIAICINIFTVVILGFRWHRLSVAQVRLSFQSQLAIYFRANFLNTFTPANLGGDAYRLVKLRRPSLSSADLVKLLLRERIIGFYGYILVFSIAYTYLLVQSGFRTAWVENPYVYGAMIAIVALGLPIVAKPLLHCTITILHSFKGGRRFIAFERWISVVFGLLTTTGALPMLGITFLGIFSWIATIQVIAHGFGFSVSWAQLAAVATLVELIRLIPVTVQGVGLREGVFAYLLGYWGYSHENSYVIAMMAYLALSVSIVLCGPISYAIDAASTERVSAFLRKIVRGRTEEDGRR
ncbi:lysylphosphatidylglycerol synthase transmembrane domain-containing protein [Pandoraea sp. SD6-2]|uniref:lysylphosphatidylglycerol synthase transmembrane domain-containing protein n=1 Tax=Pandoraea sp. SD6-2 TaxID=1286093 RepID=UPI00032D848D|nr:lysylphosphatidylglycerol synthase transmembrane domain-containing protein [Pandoraea sp. SD6-2]EON13586.1 hypothetical protein C266_10591 [Pandoraea sp. SD6-2]